MFNKHSLKKIKLIVTDLDGAILNSKNEISSSTKSLVKKLNAKGIRLTFASGRPFSAMGNFISELNIELPVISLDGCCICYPESGQVIYESFVPAKYVSNALSLADEYLLNVVLCQNKAIYYTDSNSVVKDLMYKFGARYKKISSYDEIKEKTLEIVFASDYKDNLQSVKNKLSFPNTFGLNISFYKSQRNGGIYYLEVRKKSVNKGKALIKLLRNISVDERNTAVIGDWYNDISLFKTRAFKVTLANGIPELKENADLVITKTNDQEGVAEFLEMLLK